ncbi:MAG: hypothetical protein JJT88_15675 [Gammaproteobacteria bacterium]|nr:hypothetical protein [Gammaproteobacteria bacterium]
MRMILYTLFCTLGSLALADDYRPTNEELQTYFSARDSSGSPGSNRSSTEDSEAFDRVAALALLQSSLKLNDSDREVFNRMLEKANVEGASLFAEFHQGVCNRLLGEDVRTINAVEFASLVHDEEDKLFAFFGEQYRDLTASLSAEGVQETERVLAKHARIGASRPRFDLNQMFSGGSYVGLYLIKENCKRRADSESVITGTTEN